MFRTKLQLQSDHKVETFINTRFFMKMDSDADFLAPFALDLTLKIAQVRRQ